jgi:hypothetical protein
LIVVAVDPGGGTGIATYDTETGAFNAYEAMGFADSCVEIQLALSNIAASQCVAENYIVTGRTATLTQQTEPLRLLGVTEYICTVESVSFKLQQPSARKPASDDKLKSLGWFKKTKDNHANDAAKHLLVYCLKNKLLTVGDMNKLRESFA